MSDVTTEELIKRAERVINPHRTEDGRVHGDVGAALISGSGKVYLGTCVDTASWGLCAERSAIAAMITDGEYQINKIVAVWRNQRTQVLHIVPPCGICREFMRQINPENLDAEIVLSTDSSKKLRDLLPCHEWPGSVDLRDLM